jgi:beta-lactam-binding protein with PASTA domain
MIRDFFNQRIGIKQIAMTLGILFTILFMVLWIIDSFVMPPFVHAIKVVTVPNITGLSLSKADPIIRDAKLRIAEVREVYNETIPKGKIISQLPFAGSEVREGRRLYITVSRGIEKVIVPYLIGKTDRDATLSLLSMGLQVGEMTFKEDEDKPYGTVLNQSISPGSKIPYGRSISLIVSQGPQGIDLVAFTGITLNQAKLLAIEYDLVVEIVNIEDRDPSLQDQDIFIEPDITRSPEFLKKGETIWLKILQR